MSETFGRLIADRRHVKGWTQTYLARVLGIDRSYLARLEAGERGASAQTLESLSRALDLDLGHLTRLAARFERERDAA